MNRKPLPAWNAQSFQLSGEDHRHAIRYVDVLWMDETRDWLVEEAAGSYATIGRFATVERATEAAEQFIRTGAI
jgi:hypothetical protein